MICNHEWFGRFSVCDTDSRCNTAVSVISLPIFRASPTTISRDICCLSVITSITKRMSWWLIRWKRFRGSTCTRVYCWLAWRTDRAFNRSCIDDYCVWRTGTGASLKRHRFIYRIWECVQFLRPTAYMLLRVYATPIPSVRPSVCLSHAWFVSKRLKVSSKFFQYLIGPSF